MFKLICYQLVVLRITLYFGIVVSSKRSTAAQAHACDAIIRVRIRDIGLLTIRDVRTAVHMGRNYTRETNTFVRKVARTL